MQYPKNFEPAGTELIKLASGDLVDVPKATPHFRRWAGDRVADTYGNKPVLDSGGSPAFAEILILRAFQQEGWEGVWVDTFRQKFRTECFPVNAVVLPPPQKEILERIREAAGHHSGCWDVFCWKGEDCVWAEAKLHRRDRIRPSQVNWLDAALKIGIGLSSFLVVEWSTEHVIRS